MSEETFNFEKAYRRLEEILDQMNSNTIALEDSIALYEEADRLMKQCSQFLNQAEQKIEVMLKDRDKKNLVDDEGNPQTEEFKGENEQLLSRNVDQ